MLGFTKRCYLDYNATYPLSDFVKEKICQHLEFFGNPSSIHHEGRLAKRAIDKARDSIARLCSFAANELYFTSGASESAATLLTPYYVKEGRPIVMSHLYIAASEHLAVLNATQFKEQDKTIIALGENGLIDLVDLQNKLENHIFEQGYPLIAIQAASGESGILQPLKEICQIVRHYQGILIVDAAQFFGKKYQNFTADHGDFFIGSGHKFGGLKGCGFWFTRQNNVAPKSWIKAGGQERGMRGGTPASLSIIASGFAADERWENLAAEEQNILALRLKLENFLQENIANLVIYGQNAPRLPNTSLFSIDKVKAESFVIAADLAGFALSAGAACSSGKVSVTKALKALNVNENLGAIRLSLGPFNCESDIMSFCQFLLKWLKNI